MAREISLFSPPSPFASSRPPSRRREDGVFGGQRLVEKYIETRSGGRRKALSAFIGLPLNTMEDTPDEGASGEERIGEKFNGPLSEGKCAHSDSYAWR